MNLELVLVLILFVAVVVGSGLALFEITRSANRRDSRYEFEKTIYVHPAGKGLRSEEDILNDR